jgi:hypothetical protein
MANIFYMDIVSHGLVKEIAVRAALMAAPATTGGEGFISLQIRQRTTTLRCNLASSPY